MSPEDLFPAPSRPAPPPQGRAASVMRVLLWICIKWGGCWLGVFGFFVAFHWFFSWFRGFFCLFCGGLVWFFGAVFSV